jgi:hypothetical protein
MELLLRRLAQIETELLHTQESDRPLERYKRGKQVAEQGLRQLVALGRMYNGRQQMEDVALTLNWFSTFMDNHWIELDKDTYMDIFHCWGWSSTIDNPWGNVVIYSREPVVIAWCEMVSPIVNEYVTR